jgi:hypothetical protein
MFLAPGYRFQPVLMPYPEILIRLQQICDPLSTLSSIRAAKQQKICQVLDNSTASNAQNGSRVSMRWLHIGRAARTSEGKNMYKLLFGIWILIYLVRVKALKDEPYTQKEAEAAIGLMTDNGPRQAAKFNSREVEMEDSGLLEEGLAT